MLALPPCVPSSRHHQRRTATRFAVIEPTVTIFPDIHVSFGIERFHQRRTANGQRSVHIEVVVEQRLHNLHMPVH